MTTRTFLALQLEEAIVARLVESQRALDAAGAQVRWVGPDNLHLTVKFLGDVNDARLDDVCCTARDLAGQVEAFEFGVRGLSAVPPGGALRMVWVGVDDPTGRLAELNDLAERSFARLGFKAENRRFHPHLTLGRVRSGRNVDDLRAAVERLAETDFGLQPAEELIVFASQLTPDGPIYSPLTTAPLG